MIGARRAILLHSAAAKLPAFQLDVDFTTSSGSSQFGCARAQSATDLATDLISTDASGTTITHFAADTLRQKTGKGLLVELTTLQRPINSEAPANQSITFGTGSNIVWMIGSGSVAVSAGTATATGYGTATQGSPVVLNVTVGGTVALAVSGSVYVMQGEAGSLASSFIKTAASGRTRNIDVVTQTTPSLFNMNEGTILCEWEDLRGNSGATSVFLQAYASAGNTITFQKTSAGLAQFVIASGGVTQASFSAANACVAGTVYRAAFSWKADNVVGYFSTALSPSKFTDSSATMPVGATVSVNLGTTQAGASAFNGRIRRIAQANKYTAAAALKTWAQAA